MKRKIDTLTDRIRGEMKRQKVTQNQAGYYIGLSQEQFSLKLSGRCEWRLKEVVGIAELLKIGGDISEILF